MSGAGSMQELKYFRDGATLVISLEGLNWRSKRRCSDKRIKKRNEELQLLISSGQMVPADEELQAITCFLDQRGSAAPQLWSTTDSRSGMVAWPPPSSISPRQCCLPEEPTRDSALISVASVVSDTPQEGPWTRLILNTQEICSLIKINLNISTQPNTVTVNQHNRFITFCDEDIPLQRFGDIGYTEDCRTFIGSSGYNNNVLGDLKYSTALSPNTNNSNGNQHELVIRDNLNNLKSRLKSCQIYDAPGILSRRDVNVKKRKSVSFDSEVMVYLFDQESPTVELHTEASTSLPDVTLEDSGTILKDDTNDFAHFIPYCVC